MARFKISEEEYKELYQIEKATKDKKISQRLKVSAVSGPDNHRGENSAGPDALGEDPHGLVVSDGVGGKRRGTEIFQGNPGDGFG